MNRFRSTIVVTLLGSAVTTLGAQQRPVSDSVQVVGVRAAFHRALEVGDSATVLRLLSPDVRILESGGSQTFGEYRSEHLSADIAYAKAVPSTPSSTRVTVVGDVAWISSTSTTTGEFNGKPVNSLGAELMVLRRISSGDGVRWMIETIHWSSRRRPPGPG